MTGNAAAHEQAFALALLGGQILTRGIQRDLTQRKRKRSAIALVVRPAVLGRVIIGIYRRMLHEG